MRRRSARPVLLSRLLSLLSPLLLALGACSPEAKDAGSEVFVFNCTDNLTASIRYLDPETAELTVNGGNHLLQRQRSASGARYVGPEVEFWNKGREAMLRLGESRYDCSAAQER